jgi:beta-lactamase superfamily II metal-dependent hydrolase
MHVRLFLGGLAALLAGLQPVSADYYTVARRATLRATPSVAGTIHQRVDVGDVLALHSNSLVDGYVNVTAANGKTGWVYRTFLSRHPGDAPSVASANALGKLKVYVLNVGQGDALYIRCPHGNHQMVIDSADTRYPGASSAFKQAISQLQPIDDPIEVAIGTHPHSDHIGNMDWLVRNYKIAVYVDDGVTATTATYKRVEGALTERQINRKNAADAAPEIDFCPLPNLTAVVLRPPGFGTLSDPNDNSVIVKLTYGADSFLFVGDCEDKQEHQLLSDPGTRALLRCRFLKLGHHGSDTSSTEEFIEVVQPEVVAVSPGAPGVSTNFGYKHPRTSSIDRLLRFVRPVTGPARRLNTYDATAKKWVTTSVSGALYSTSLDGELLFESDGNGIRFVPGR